MVKNICARFFGFSEVLLCDACRGREFSGVVQIKGGEIEIGRERVL